MVHDRTMYGRNLILHCMMRLNRIQDDRLTIILHLVHWPTQHADHYELHVMGVNYRCSAARQEHAHAFLTSILHVVYWPAQHAGLCELHVMCVA